TSFGDGRSAPEDRNRRATALRRSRADDSRGLPRAIKHPRQRRACGGGQPAALRIQSAPIQAGRVRRVGDAWRNPRCGWMRLEERSAKFTIKNVANLSAHTVAASSERMRIRTELGGNP